MVFLIGLILFVIVLYSFIRTGMWIFGSIGDATRSRRERERDEFKAHDGPANPFERKTGWTSPVEKAPAPKARELDSGRTNLPDRQRW